MRRFFLPASHLTDNHATLTGPEFHHLRHVLRLSVGASVVLRDDRAREHQGVVASLTDSTAIIAITATTPAPVSTFTLTLAQGLLKGQKMDLLVEKATELGVQRLLPFTSTFTVAQMRPGRQDDRISRWKRIAQSAAKQSGSHPPQIASPCSFHDLFSTLPAETPTLLFYEKDTSLTLKAFAQQHPRLSALNVIIGSEGGFSSEEIAAADNAGAHLVSLGSTILRAETAAIAVVVLCRFLWGD